MVFEGWFMPGANPSRKGGELPIELEIPLFLFLIQICY